jgi:hypothetical protein
LNTNAAFHALPLLEPMAYGCEPTIDVAVSH